MRRGTTLATLIAALLCQLDGGPTEAADLPKEAAVLEAAFRQQIQEHLDATARARRTVVCAAIDPGGSIASCGNARAGYRWGP